MKLLLACCILALPLPDLPAPAFDNGPTISQADLVADFDGWLAGMRALNPDLSIRVDMQALERESARIRANLREPMSRREGWLQFALLNPYLGDAHAGIQMPGYRAALDAHLEAGGHVVPVEVRFAQDGSLRVFTVAPGIDGVNPGDRLLSINGHSTDELLSAMLSRSIGETPAFRRAFVVRRFAMFYWYLYGDTGQYDLVVQPAADARPRRVRAVGATTLPEALRAQRAAADMFDWSILPGDIGYLRVDGFDADQKDALAGITQTAFAAFKARTVRAVIIDVRENGGGDDPLWQQELVNHFTTKPYAQLSHYVVRINQDNADPGDVIGSVQSSDYSKRFTPPPVDPVRYDGPVYILAGPYSYSATIQFLVAAQDFGLAKIAGEETAAFSCQTGKVKAIVMPRTGLAAFTPTIAFTRPSGAGCTRGVLPDVSIAIDE
ncbi:MAG TPA: S41 family peptidase, partial [Steroidobacteraceae bacterium]|nr:S41 family peptidase [Steroidobacteraceae bacterium]